MADDVIRLADNLRIRRMHIVGHSMGAAVAANVAARYPRRVISVTVIAGPFYRDSVTFARETSRWVSELQAGRGITALLLWLLPGLDSASALGLNKDAMARNDLGSLIAVLPSLGALVGPLDHAPVLPALIAVGGNDPLSFYSHELANRWTSARLLEMSTANHMTVLSNPQLLAALRAIAHSH
jgi:pimeloyl-ACP methyl ester carboxylesterase